MSKQELTPYLKIQFCIVPDFSNCFEFISTYEKETKHVWIHSKIARIVTRICDDARTMIRTSDFKNS